MGLRAVDPTEIPPARNHVYEQVVHEIVGGMASPTSQVDRPAPQVGTVTSEPGFETVGWEECRAGGSRS